MVYHRQGSQPVAAGVVEDVMPRELSKVVLPLYRIEPPDILMIEAVRMVPQSPYTLRAHDVLSIEVEGAATGLRPADVVFIEVTGALSDAPIAGQYAIGPDGVVNLGPPYGSVGIAKLTVEEAEAAVEKHLGELLVEPAVSLSLAESGTSPIGAGYSVQMGGVINLGLPYGSINVGGMTVEEAQIAIQQHFSKFLNEPSVLVTLAEAAATQQIQGEHLVNPDGTVTLGTYGSVGVVGLTVDEAKSAIEQHLSEYLEDPEISVSVFAYNSKVYYVITQGAGLGDAIFRYPVTGNETVLDAISQINGLNEVSSKRIWIARPAPEPGNVQVLPVDWDAITAQASTSSNYQILPGDRIFVAHDKLVAFDTSIGKLVAPVERLMGFSLLGAGTVTRFSGPVLRGGGARGVGGGFGGF